MVQKTIFADTNYFCGLYNPKDTLYLKCRNIFAKIEDINAKILISNYIVIEGLTILKQKVSKKAAQLFWQIATNKEIEIIWIEKELQVQAFKVFENIINKNISFVDASNLAVIKKHKIDFLLTFDKQLIKIAKSFNIEALEVQF